MVAKRGFTEKATGERYKSKAAMTRHEKKESPSTQRGEVRKAKKK